MRNLSPWGAVALLMVLATGVPKLDQHRTPEERRWES